MNLPILKKSKETREMDRELIWSMEEYESDEDFGINSLIEEIKHFCKGDRIIIRANKVDWTGRPGYKVVEMRGRSNEKIFWDIMPKHDFNFNLYCEDGKIYAVVSSHDIPTGATWTFESEESENE